MSRRPPRSTRTYTRLPYTTRFRASAVICTAYHPGKNPAMTWRDLPLLPFPDLDVQQKVHEAYYRHPAVVAEMKRWNAVAVFSNLLPQSEFIGTGAPPKSLDDWKGRRVQAMP